MLFVKHHLIARVRLLLLLGCLGFLVCTSPPVLAQSVVYCQIQLGNPGEGPPQSDLFSGTDNNFVVYASTMVYNLASLVITINGTVVDDIVPPPNDPIPPYAPISVLVTFDSTHFPNGSQVLLQATCTDAMGNQAISTQVGTVVNNALLYGRNDFENTPGGNGCAAAAPQLAAMNHTVTTNTTLGWNAQTFLNSLGAQVTALYVNTHGDSTPSIFSDADEVTNTWEAIYPFSPAPDTYEACANHVIPINIAFLDACETGQTDAFAQSLLYPFRAVSNPGVNDAIDQAEVGWAVDSFVAYTNAASNQFWHQLAQGLPVYAARDAAVNAQYQPILALYQQNGQWPRTWPSPQKINPNGPLPNKLNDNQCQLFAYIWGDYYATLHGVYTGNAFTSAQVWYLVH